MVTVSFRETHMIVTVKGLHKLLAFKSELAIPIDQVVDAKTDTENMPYPMGMRAPGTHFPGLIIAGTYRANGRKVFWDVRNMRKAVVIDLKNNAYDRLVVEVHDPQATVKRILEQVKNDWPDRA